MGITAFDPSVAWSVGSSSSRYLSMEIVMLGDSRCYSSVGTLSG
jgi:hypothetical protein